MRKAAINPLEIIAAKQKVGRDEADKIALPVLISLDAAKRGQAPSVLANTLTEHLLMAVTIFSKAGNRPLYDCAAKAWMALCKACARPTVLLDLTTGEYAAIRVAIAYYLRALPNLEMCVLLYAASNAMGKLNGPEVSE